MKRLRLPRVLAPLSATLLTLTATACGKGADPTAPSAQDAVSSTSNPATAAPDAAPGATTTTETPSEPGANAGDAPKVMDDPARAGEIVARIDDTPVTRGTLVAWMNRRPGRRAVDVLDELVNLHLFGGVAKTEGFAAPAGVDPEDRMALGEAWAKATFAPTEPTDEDMQRWFAERRAAHRLVVNDEALANRLADEFRATPTGNPRDAMRKFNELVREHSAEKSAIAPRRTLFDAAGLGETGEPVVHETVARLAFGIANDGEIAGPVPLGDGRFVVVQRLAARPAMELAQVPPHMVERAREGLKTKRANAAMQARAAELRRGARVVIEDKAFEDLRPAINPRSPIAKGGPLDLRRMRHDRVIGKEGAGRLEGLIDPHTEAELEQVMPADRREKTGTAAP